MGKGTDPLDGGLSWCSRPGGCAQFKCTIVLPAPSATEPPRLISRPQHDREPIMIAGGDFRIPDDGIRQIDKAADPER